MTFAAVILAAGSSARFGRNKLRMPFGTSTVLETVIAHIALPEIREILIVTGAYADQIRTAVPSPPIRWVNNAGHDQGMSSSVRLAARHTAEDVTGVLITPGDLPSFERDTVRVVLEAFRTDRIIIPRHRNKKGHPILIDRAIFAECLSSKLDRVLYEVIKNHEREIIYADVEDEGILKDIDTPEDYEDLMRDFPQGR